MKYLNQDSSKIVIKKKKTEKSEKLSEPRGHDNNIQCGRWAGNGLFGKMRNSNKIWKFANTNFPVMIS